MQIKPIPMFTMTFLMFATSCSMIEAEPTDDLRFEFDNPDEPAFDETPLECLDDPVVIEAEEPLVVWPPNHEFHEIALADCVASVSGGCFEGDVDPNEVLQIAAVTSDEAVNDNGDGNTCEDTIMFIDEDMVKVLAERSGSTEGDGRVYTIWVSLADDSAGEVYEACEVHVPLGHNVPVVNGDCRMCVAHNDASACDGCASSECE